MDEARRKDCNQVPWKHHLIGSKGGNTDAPPLNLGSDQPASDCKSKSGPGSNDSSLCYANEMKARDDVGSDLEIIERGIALWTKM